MSDKAELQTAALREILAIPAVVTIEHISPALGDTALAIRFKAIDGGVWWARFKRSWCTVQTMHQTIDVTVDRKEGVRGGLEDLARKLRALGNSASAVAGYLPVNSPARTPRAPDDDLRADYFDLRVERDALRAEIVRLRKKLAPFSPPPTTVIYPGGSSEPVAAFVNGDEQRSETAQLLSNPPPSHGGYPEPNHDPLAGPPEFKPFRCALPPLVDDPDDCAMTGEFVICDDAKCEVCRGKIGDMGKPLSDSPPKSECSISGCRHYEDGFCGHDLECRPDIPDSEIPF